MASKERTPRLCRNTRIGDIVFYVEEIALKEEAALFEEYADVLNRRTAWPLVILGLILVTPVLAFINWIVAVAIAVVGLGLGVLANRLPTDVKARKTELEAKVKARGKELEVLNDTIKQKCESLGIRCFGCDAAPKETFEQGAKLHGFDLDAVLAGLRDLDLDLTALPNPDEGGSHRPR